MLERATLLGRRIAGAHPDADVRGVATEPLRGEPDAAMGACRLRSTSWTSALSGET